MRLCSIAVFGLLIAVGPSCPQQSRSRVAANNTKDVGSSAKRLLLEVLQTDSGVGGTNQFVYLRVFSDGSVEYHPRRNQELKRERVSRGQISEEELEATAKTLAREDVAELPSIFPSTYTPIDFYWTLDFTIFRNTQNQKIKVVNFYPAMAAQNKKSYPEALVRLVCTAWSVRNDFPTQMPDLSGDCQRFAVKKSP